MKKQFSLSLTVIYFSKNYRKLFLVFGLILNSLFSFSQNLLINGGFECGGKGNGFNINSGTYTDVTALLPRASSNVGDYAVTNNPVNVNSSTFISGTDRSGVGNMLVCDGITTGGQQIFWQAGSSGGGICGLTVGATYLFTYYVKSISTTCTDPSTCASLAIKFNNTSTGQWPAPTSGFQQVGLPAAGWQKVTYTFIPTNACVNIEMTNNNTGSVGNDFALDDMSVVAAVQPALSINLISKVDPTCIDGTNGAIYVSGNGGASPYTYTLSGAASSSNSTGTFTGLSAGNYNVSVTDGTPTTVAYASTIKLGNIEDTLIVSADVSICNGSSTTLSVSGGYPVPYVWSPLTNLNVTNNANPVASPTSTTPYTVTSQQTITKNSTENLIVNGDFSLGNNGFYSDYAYLVTNPSGLQKTYGVLTNPQTFFPSFSTCGDKTTGTGKMLVADGSIYSCGSKPADKVWSQSVSVVPGKIYTFSYWVQTVATPNPAQIETQINGTSLGTATAPAAATCGGWAQKTYSWTAGPGVYSAQIALYDKVIASNGNDFAIDDISFTSTTNVTTTCTLSKTITVNVTSPVAPTITCGTSTISSVQFNWGAIAGATSYTISYTINGGTPIAASVTAPTTTYSVSSLSSGDAVAITITPVGSGCYTSGTQTCNAIACTPPTVTVPTSFAICNNENVAATTFSSSPAGATYTWTNSNTAIGLAANGSGNVPSFTATNSTGANITATITVTPTLVCGGTPSTYVITVKPTPVAPTVTVTNNCNGTSDLTASAYTGTLTWSNSATSATINVSNAATYTVFQTVNGCPSSNGSGTSAPKSTPVAPTVTVTNNCNGTSDLTASVYTGTLTWSNSSTSATINVSNAATYTVFQTVNGCPSPNGSGTSAPRSTPVAPTVTVTNNCNGTSDLTASAYTGTLTWSNSSTNASINVSNAATYTVYQTVNGCPSPNGSGTSAPNTNPATPTGSVTVQPTCTVSGTIVITSPIGAIYEYSVNGLTYQTSPTFTGLSPAGYNVTVRNTSSLCVSNALALTVSPPLGAPAPPTASVTVQPTCTSPTGTITITNPIGINYEYSNGGAFQSGTTFSSLAPNANYNISVREISTGCVSNATSLNVNAIPANPNTPTASVTVQPTCTTPTGTIVITAPTGVNLEYSNGGAYQAATTFSSLSPATNYNITVRNTSTGCVSSPLSLAVNAIPANPATPTASVTVQPTCTTPTGTIVITAPTGVNLEYSNGGTYQTGTSFSGLTPAINYNITVRNTSTGCVSSPLSLAVNAIPANPATPTASVTVQPTCTTPTGTIVITAPTGANLEYSNGGAYQTGTTFSNLSPGTNYNITVRNTSTGCISSPLNLAVNAIPANPAIPTASVTVQPTCTAPSGTIVITAPTGANLEYSNGGAYQAGTTFSNLNPATSYSIRVKNVLTGCISSALNLSINSIPVKPATPTALVTVQPNCTSPSGTISISAPLGSNIEYNINSSTYQIGTNFSGLAPSSSNIITARDITTGCISNPRTISVNPLPGAPSKPTVSVTAQPTCIIPSGTISITNPSSNSIVYSIDGTTYQSNKIYPGLDPGATYSITAKDNLTNCISVPTVLTINPIPANPIADAGTDKEILEGQSATLTGNASGNGITFNWTPSLSITNANTLTPTVKPTSNQTYTLTVTSRDGCVSSDNVNVVVLKDIIVPNAFSPNGDGINDRWIISNIEYYPNSTISVFNRYGQFLFESTGYTIPWDGKHKGQIVPVGTYFWIIKLNSTKKPISGSVSVIR